MTTTATTTPAPPAGGATTSSPELFGSDGRPDPGAAVARTEELYRRHRRLVGGLCHALLRDQAEAEDAAQQTFLSAHRALVNGSSPEEPAAWLATIARNECWARIRSRMREPLPTAEVDREASSSDPLAEAIRNADLAAIWSAIAALPRQQRDALLLREFGGLSYEELAGALAVSDSAVESLLFRARQGVRTRLKTAYAGVTGASWLESLARLAGGLGGGMAPVATKVAVVGVGAAVATGGAVVGPQMIERPTRSPHDPTALMHKASTHVKAKTQQAVAQPMVPIYADRTRAPAVMTASLRVSVSDEVGSGSKSSSHEDGSSLTAGRSSSGDDHSSGGEDHASSSHHQRSRSRDRSTTSDDARQSDYSSDSSASSDGSATHEGTREAAPRQPDQPDESARPESDSAPAASSEPSDGGGTTTTANPVVTVTVPTGDAPPLVGVPRPGEDG